MDGPLPDASDPVPTDAAAETEELLSSAVVRAVQETGAHAGSIFLRSRDRRSIVLAAACGTPPSLLGGWRLIPVSSPIPVATAYRSGRTVHLADGDETMRRFPQLSVALPYAFGSASVPVKAGRESFGALAVVWAAPPGSAGLSKARLRHLRATANRLGASLAAIQLRGGLAEWDAETVVIEVPAPSPPAVRVGLFDWELDTGALTADDELCAIFGLDPSGFDGRADTLASRVHPSDLAAFRAAARAAVVDGRILAQRIRVLEADGTHRPVELWGRVPEGPTQEARSHLVGAALDPGAGTRAVAAIERLRDGVFSLDPEGRLTYVNRGLEQLLGVRREEVLGQSLWEVLPWLSSPVHEDRHRAAMVSQQPTSFVARRPPDQWIAFSLHPDAGGVTGRAVPVESPPSPAARPGAPAEGTASAAEGRSPPTASSPAASPPSPVPAGPTAPARLAAIYHVLQLGSALTEAVSAREVCAVVADQLLPAFGGRQLAIHVVREGRMHLLAQTGHHGHFLDWFEDVPLNARLPGTQALTSGTPLFIESREDLANSYPGLRMGEARSWAYLPLIASSRPVGTCVLGFDEVHRFSVEERSVLSALGGLIAQALERARVYDEEFAIARGLQDALLPHRLPELANIHIAGRYLPGTSGMDIGGDWYDVIRTADAVALVVGDVEGHSVTAAGAMGQLRSAVRAFATAGHRPGDVVAGANRILDDLGAELLASCCYIRLETGSGQTCAVRAGHPPPLLRRPGGTTEVLDLEGGTLLGVDRSTDYPETRLELPPGSVLALYTDGLVEERDTDIGLGIDHLRATLAHTGTHSLEKLADGLLRAARRSAKREDDIALLLTEYAPGHHAAGAH
ncbi:SpoIIE family protein phosphatase [Wenjunlia tyrosinilytica]|uniref:SpoIIE family protein phosphatase n=1 Tax=Wenjunlia tyrosinilytica TaxID=1544741 RepID=UPI001E34A421|nr:SpoIIE family protein phosphatase [Wenjunlia tyrosinilytica]